MVPSMPYGVVPRGGHFYFGETGHFTLCLQVPKPGTNLRPLVLVPHAGSSCRVIFNGINRGSRGSALACSVDPSLQS